jgi:hypothetical protein
MARVEPLALKRRDVLLGGGAVALLLAGRGAARAADLPRLDFEDMYGAVGVLGLSFSDKIKTLAGRTIRMAGFIAPPLKAEADFFVLTQIPMSICPFCSSDADWPATIVVVYLDKAQTFEQLNALIHVDGKLEIGSWTDPATGFVSLVRLRNARFAAA